MNGGWQSVRRATVFWLIRHALVEAPARAVIYGTDDVAVCEETIAAEAATLGRLAARLPRPARWVVSPLRRTRRTAEAIFEAGYPPAPLAVEPGLIEQDLGEWQGLSHAELERALRFAPHPFWPHAAEEEPPGGETMAQVVQRVGAALEGLAEAEAGHDIVVVSHGGAIRAALAHAMDAPCRSVLHLSIRNLSLTGLERHEGGWRVVMVNAEP